jgi:hypothetical protein
MKMRRRWGFGKAEGEVKSSSFVVMVVVPCLERFACAPFLPDVR